MIKNCLKAKVWLLGDDTYPTFPNSKGHKMPFTNFGKHLVKAFMQFQDVSIPGVAIGKSQRCQPHAQRNSELGGGRFTLKSKNHAPPF